MVSQPWLANIKVGDKTVVFKIDSRTDKTVITAQTYKRRKNN